MKRTCPHDVEDALDVALSRLRRGESIDSCLPADDALAGELAPLLSVALQLQSLSLPEPPPARALRAARKRFLREASRMRPRPAPLDFRACLQMPRHLGALFAPLLRRGAASTVVLVALLVVLLAGTTMMTSASSSSLPGDPLYRVKRAAESVHLALTFDQDSRAALESAIESRRIQEARAVLERQRETTVSFRAVVESYQGAALVASGLTVQVDPATRMIGPLPVAGRIVSIVAVTRPEGKLVAQQIHTLEATPQPRQPKGRATATQTADLADLVPPSPTPQVGVTATAALTPSLEPGDVLTPTVELVVTETAVPSATSTITCTGSPTATCTPAPTAVVTPAAVVHLVGLVEAMGPDGWRVAGQEVAVSADTRLIELDGQATVGAWVRVRAVQQPDGSLLAAKVVVERPAGDAGEMVTFAATVQEIAAGYWMVGGQRLAVDATTQIVGEPRVGAMAAVEAARGPEGRLSARHITVLAAPEEQLVEIDGVIEEAGTGQWVVAGRTVRVDDRTLVVGEPAVGRQVAILGLEEPDGALRALLVYMAWAPTPSPSSTQTQTQTPTQTPTPTPSQAPTAAKTPTPTPTPTR